MQEGRQLLMEPALLQFDTQFYNFSCKETKMIILAKMLRAW